MRYNRMLPDWWHEVRRAEVRIQAKSQAAICGIDTELPCQNFLMMLVRLTSGSPRKCLLSFGPGDSLNQRPR